MSDRISYELNVTVNGRDFNRVVIDQHYKNKHADTINDQLILRLVNRINGRTLDLEDQNGDFQYFKVEPLIFYNQPYRLIITICIVEDFLGVVNCFRINRRDYE